MCSVILFEDNVLCRYQFINNPNRPEEFWEKKQKSIEFNHNENAARYDGFKLIP
jgi:hypothetical protein